MKKDISKRWCTSCLKMTLHIRKGSGRLGWIGSNARLECLECTKDEDLRNRYK